MQRPLGDINFWSRSLIKAPLVIMTIKRSAATFFARNLK